MTATAYPSSDTTSFKERTMHTPLELSHLSCGYDSHNVLEDISLSLAPGSITGLLGRNGAGKTTLMRAAMGLMKPSQGDALLFGAPAWDSAPDIRQQVGYVSQSFNFFPKSTVGDCIELIGSLYPTWDHDYINKIKSQWDIQDQPVDQLSPGQKQKAAILLALGHRPDLLILDEPVASLDPSARREFLSMLVELNSDSGQTILLSSHITSDIERVCSDVAILASGRLVCQADLDELKESVYCIQSPEPPTGGKVLVSRGDRHWVQALNGSVPTPHTPLPLEDLFLEMTK